MLAPDEIQIPDLRITSQVDDHILEELMASISREGILQPLQVARVKGTYVLEDGLHRLYVAKKLGIPTVPCIVHDATEGQVMIRNLVLNRQRGKSNPVQECQVVKYLAEVEGKTMVEVSELTGLSTVWLGRLYKVASLPLEVTRLIEEGLLAVTSAYHLASLENKDDQIQAARDAANWKYTESQVKARVLDIQGERAEPKPGDVAFAGNGKPTIIPLTCYWCLSEIDKGDNYIWTCPDCRTILVEFWRMYQAQSAAPAPPPEPARPQRMTLTEQGWRPVGG
jgi:ParB/RepB/Spo0J family partition protein